MEKVSYSSIDYKSRRFYLRESIQVVVECLPVKGGECAWWIYEYSDLDICGCSMIKERAEKLFREEFSACWDYIANEEDKNLTGDAVEMKRRILYLVDRVEDI